MKLRRTIDTILYWSLAALMAVMTLNVLWQVASRYIIGIPSSFTDELARYLLIWVSLLGASYVTGKKLHLAIDILPSKLEGEKQRRLNVGINLLVAFFALFAFVWGGVKLVYITLTLEQTSPSLNLPLGVVYAVLPLSGIIIIYYSIANLFTKAEDSEVVGKEMF
jgi:TRAP-type C4-dicarboxylate transport system permease small subunit